MQETQFDSWVKKIRWRRDRLPTPLISGFPGGSAGKESTCNEGDLGSIPGLGRSPGEGKGYPLLYSGLENSRDYTVHGISKSWTQLSDFHLLSLSDCSLPGSTAHGISQARIVEWIAIAFSRGSSGPRVKPMSPALAVEFFTTEPSRKPPIYE